MKNFIKRSILFAVIALSTFAFFMLASSAESSVDNDIYYGREALSTLENSEALIFAYDMIVDNVEAHKQYIFSHNEQYPLTPDEIETVLDAYRRDHTEHFQIGSSYSISHNGEHVIRLSIDYIMTESETEAARAAFEEKVSEILSGLSPDMTELQKELYIHNSLASIITYDASAPNAHNSYGAIVEGRAVCEGYSEAFQYLLQRAGIRSFIIIGTGTNIYGLTEGHSWNLVEIDGKYYHADLTWNDQDSFISYAYFNVTDKIINEEHTVDGAKYPIPECTSEDALYYKNYGGYLNTYNTDIVSALMHNGQLSEDTLVSLPMFIPSDPNGFVEWLPSNINTIAQNVGITGNYSAGYSYFGHEFKLILSGDIKGVYESPVKITESSISLGSDLTMKFYVTASDTCSLDTDAFSLKVTLSDKTVILNEYIISSDGKYVFSFEKIAPQLMSELINIELFNAGVSFYSVSDYSVKKNAQSLLNSHSDDPELVSLVSDMLRYGAAAQLYRGYKTDDLATDGILGMSGAEDFEIASSDKELITEDCVGDIYFTGAGVWFDNTNKIYVRLSSFEGASLILKLNGATVKTYGELDIGTVYTENIFAADFNSVYTFELYDGGTLVQTFNYSIRSYCYSMQYHEKEAVRQLAKALYSYGCSAYEYKNAE